LCRLPFVFVPPLYGTEGFFARLPDPLCRASFFVSAWNRKNPSCSSRFSCSPRLVSQSLVRRFPLILSDTSNVSSLLLSRFLRADLFPTRLYFMRISGRETVMIPRDDRFWALVFIASHPRLFLRLFTAFGIGPKHFDKEEYR